VQPFSRMVKIGADFNLGKLQRVEPLFAQAVALALAGAQRQDQPAANHDLSPKLRWLMPGIDSQVKKFRRVALGFSLLILLFTALTSLQLERKQQEYWTLNSKRQDLQQRIYLHQNSTLLNSWLMSTPQQLLNTQMPRASQILQVVGEIIPTGAWITQVQILPSDQIVEFKAIPKMPKVSVPVLIIEGRAVSSNFVGEFFNRLNDSGYFTQIILKRQDSRIDLSNSVGYSILAQIGNSHETRAVKN